MMAVFRFFGVVTLAVGGLLLYSTAGPLFHLHQVRVEGNGGWLLRQEEVRAGLRASGKMSLVFGDFTALEQAVSDKPSVRWASVRRQYPHTLVLEVMAREPVARIAGGGLVDRSGEWYASVSPASLPIFAVGRPALPLAVAFHADAVELLRPLELGINQLRQDAEGWRLFLSNGWVLQLGQRKLRDRLKRFVVTWHQLQMTLEPGAHLRVDLRYPHGMAVAGLQEKGEGL